MKEAEHPSQKLIVLDFDGHCGQLIARKIRDLHVYSEVVSCDISAEELSSLHPSALILAGEPEDTFELSSSPLDPEVLQLGIPTLGIGYGQQVMASNFDESTERFEVAKQEAASLVYPLAAENAPSPSLFATQLHPKLVHTEDGIEVLSNFLFEIATFEPSWTAESIIEHQIETIRDKVGNDRVILALSGGVDSAVTAALLHRAIGKQLTCIFVNHGCMRKNEPEHIEQVFAQEFGIPLIVVNAKERYLKLLSGVTDPEQKRKIIGTEFWKVFFEEAEKVGGARWLAQGTIYPDIIESGSRKTDGKASVVKSHHNLIPFPEGVHFDLIEPLDHFFKDEVRVLGTALGLPDSVVYRQPFPGPGLAIRVIGDITSEKLDVLKEADAIVREELDAYNQDLFEKTGVRNSECSVWQYFAILPDVRSVGVKDGERTYAHPIVLRAVHSEDAMSADWAKLPYEVLSRISGRIVSEVDGVNRVAYDITSKPPATIEWE